MSVLDPRELEASPLADLHALAAELGLEGYRRLRKEELIKQLVRSTGGDPDSVGAAGGSDDDEAGEPDVAPQVEPVADVPDASDDSGADADEADDAAENDDDSDRNDSSAGDDERPPSGRGRGRGGRGGSGRGGSRRGSGRGASEDDDDGGRGASGRGASGRGASDDDDDRNRGRGASDDDSSSDDTEEEGEPRTGILDVLPNGSGFIRAEPYQQSREDVYVSPAQIRRCELRPGDEVSGPARPPRRNERHPSLVHVATVNGQDADSPSERSRFNSLTAVWPTERLGAPGALAGAPYGKGSRVAIGGPPGAGATWILREAVKVLRERHSDLEIVVVLAGARPEEAVEWAEAGIEVAGGSFDDSFDEQAQVADLAVQRAKRSAEAGRDAVVVVDSLDALPPAAARRVFGAGRNTQEAGSLTILAATGMAAEPHRMATTHVTLEPSSGDGAPTLGAGSGTLRRDLLD